MISGLSLQGKISAPKKINLVHATARSYFIKLIQLLDIIGGITEIFRPGFSKNLSLSIKLGFKNSDLGLT